MATGRARISHVVPVFETVPPRGDGGTERITATLCDRMVAQGHEVTLFAAAGSATSARLIESRPCGPRADSAARVSPPRP